MDFSLPSFAIRKPITVIMIALTLASLGWIAMKRTPLKFMPEMDFPYVMVFFPYPGATPEQVEKEVAIPAEGEFRTIPHLDRITTTSNDEGCEVFMRFAWEAQMGLATAEVRDRIERLKLTLPKEIDNIIVQRFSAGALPVIAFGMFKKGDEEEFAHLIRTVFRPKLLRLPGVADVEIFSSKPERDILIEFNQNALRQRNLPLYTVISQLQTANLNMSSGEMIEGRTKYFVRVMGELRRPEELADLIIGPNSLRLKDVAKVGYNPRDVDWHYEIDSQGGAFVLVRKESEANTVATCRAVLDELEKAKTDPIFSGVKVLTFFDQSDLILSALRNLIDSGKAGGLLSVLVLFLFLRQIWPTIMVALAIPSSLVCAFVYMYFTGMTLNVVTMVSLIVAVGMLVDNSIVVIENIFRYRDLGLSPMESARRGASEVGMAISASTLTTVVVFIPVVYMEGGQMSVYMKEFAVPMVVSLAGSLAIALTLIPLATSRMKPYVPAMDRPWLGPTLRLGSRVVGQRISRILSVFKEQHILNGIIALYAFSLRFTMKRRMTVIVFTCLVLVITQMIPYKRVGIQQMPKLDMRQVNVDVELDQNFDMKMADDVFVKLKNTIDPWRDELGIKSVFTHYTPRGGTLEVGLLEVADMPEGQLPPYPTDDVLDILWTRLPRLMPGVEVKLAIPESEQEGDTRGISIRFRGDDTARLTQIAENFKKLMEEIPNVSDVKVDNPRAKQEVQIKIDDPLAQEAGISPMMVARTVDVALRGNPLPYIKHGGRDVPVWAQFQEEDRKSKDNLDNVAVIGQKGALVPLNQLVDFSKARSSMRIRRIDGRNFVRLNAKISTNDYTTVQNRLRDLVNYFELPLGYTIELGDEFEELNRNIANFVRTLITAIILVYIVMAAMFESYILPISILTTVPLSFVGVYWTMYFTGTAMDAVSFIGCILMVGVIVNNGIVLVDHINLLRSQGVSRLEAIVQSGRDRFRPVMMTAITTILGCLPLAFGSEYGSRVTFMSLGRAFIGGLTAGTILTLIIVPLCYSIIDDLRVWTSGFLSDLGSFGRHKVRVDS